MLWQFQLGLPSAVYKWMETKDITDMSDTLIAAQEALILFPNHERSPKSNKSKSTPQFIPNQMAGPSNQRQEELIKFHKQFLRHNHRRQRDDP